MRTLLLASACILVISGSALACRGTDEFPQAFEQLDRSTVSAERMQELRHPCAPRRRPPDRACPAGAQMPRFKAPSTRMFWPLI